MELFNKSGVIVTATLLMVGMLIACQVQEQVQPPAPVVETVARKLAEHGGVAAERRLREWAEQGSAVAARELGLRYAPDASRHAEAIQLLEKAARAGDSISADYLTRSAQASINDADIKRDRNWLLQARLATPEHAK